MEELNDDITEEEWENLTIQKRYEEAEQAIRADTEELEIDNYLDR